MKVAQLKAELAERGSTRTGLKAVLQRRLHALIVQAARELHAPVQSMCSSYICLMQGGHVQGQNLTDPWPGPDRRPKFDKPLFDKRPEPRPKFDVL